MDDKKREETELLMKAGLNLHFGSQKALTHCIENLINHSPVHAQACEHDFQYGFTMILLSMRSAIEEFIRDREELLFEGGKICIDMEKREEKLKTKKWSMKKQAWIPIEEKDND